MKQVCIAVMLVAGVFADGHKDDHKEMDEYLERQWDEYKSMNCHNDPRPECPPQPDYPSWWEEACGHDGHDCEHWDKDHHGDHEKMWDDEDWNDMWYESATSVTASAATLMAAVLALNA